MSDNNLMIFEDKPVEVFEFEGRILFNPKDVAKCLEITDVNSVIRNFNQKQKVKLKNSDMHSMQFRKLNNAGENFLTESGVYKLIFKSKKKEAERFQDWVTDEVLPNIRKNGGYINNTDIFINTYFGALDSVTKSMVKGLCKNIEEQQKTITVLKPKAEGFDTFINTENLYKWNVVAKNLGIGRNTMLEILRNEKILMTDKYIDRNGKEKRGENHNVPYQSYMKYFDVKFSMVDNRRCATVLVKAEGQEYLRKKLTKLGYLNKIA